MPNCDCPELERKVEELKQRLELLESAPQRTRRLSNYQQCIKETELKGKDLPPRVAFCVKAKLCSGKSRSEEEALGQCTGKST